MLEVILAQVESTHRETNDMNSTRHIGFECMEERLCFSALSFVHQETEIVQTVAVADLNGDRRPDLVQVEPVDPSGVSWFLSLNKNDQRELDRHPVTYTLEAGLTGVKAEDVDGDGDLDLAFIENELQWFENLDGLGSYDDARVIPGEGAQYFEFGDVDSDGDKDLIVLGVSVIAGQVDVWWHANRDGKGDFGPAEFIAELGDFLVTTPKDLAIDDLDGDDDIDIVAAVHFDDGRGSKIQTFANEGSGSFGPPRQVEVAPGCNFTCSALSISIGDVDGDADSDIVVLDRRGLTWNENRDGEGDFGRSRSIPGNISASSGHIQLADLDADGDFDLVTGTSDLDATLTWSENIDGSFGQPKVIATDRADLFWLVDLDQDGDVDVQTAFGDWFESTADEAAELLGDLNRDGTVAFDDFLILAMNFGRDDVDNAADGDLNGDRVVDFRDFLLLAQNFGKSIL